MLIIRKPKLHYTASGIITAIGGRLVHETATEIEKVLLTVVLYIYVQLGLSEERKHREALKNRIMRDIFGPKGVKVTEDWRRLRNEELHD